MVWPRQPTGWAEPIGSTVQPVGCHGEPIVPFMESTGSTVRPTVWLIQPTGWMAESTGSMVKSVGWMAKPAGSTHEPVGLRTESTGSMIQPTGWAAKPVGSMTVLATKPGIGAVSAAANGIPAGYTGSIIYSAASFCYKAVKVLADGTQPAILQTLCITKRVN